MGLETNQPDGSRDNPADVHTRPRLGGTSPRGGERAALTVSPLIYINPGVTPTQLATDTRSFLHVALPAPAPPGRGGRSPGRRVAAAGRVAWAGMGEEAVAAGKGRARPDPAEPRWN